MSGVLSQSRAVLMSLLSNVVYQRVFLLLSNIVTILTILKLNIDLSFKFKCTKSQFI